MSNFCVAGANTALFDRSLIEAGGGTHLLGYLPDIRSVYDQADIFVAPLRSGNGMRVKLLEAFSMGKAVVATRLAAAGFTFKPGEHLLLAETAEEFADQITRLLLNPSLQNPTWGKCQENDSRKFRLECPPSSLSRASGEPEWLKRFSLFALRRLLM